MKIALFGGTRGVGLQVLKQGLQLGHSFRILSRSGASKFPQDLLGNEFSEKVEIVQGDATDQNSVSRIIEGTEQVIVSLGSRGSKDAKVCSISQPLINAAVKQYNEQSENKHPIKRIILVSSIGVGSSYNDASFLVKLLVATVLSRAIADKEIQERYLREIDAENVDYVIVRPGGLSDQAVPSGKYKYAESGISGGSISRADVAHFILHKCLKEATGDWSNKSISVVSA